MGIKMLNIFDYISPKVRLLIKPEFKSKLINCAMKNAGKDFNLSRTGRRALSKKLNISETTISDWMGKGTRPTFKEACYMGKLSNISSANILKNTEYITASQDNGRIHIKNWKLAVDEDFSEMLGLLDGDGSIGKYSVRFCNNNLDLIMFFIKASRRIFNVSENQIEITIRPAGNIDDVNKIIEYFQLNNLFRIRIAYEPKRKFIRNASNIAVRINSRILSELISNVLSELPDIIKDSHDNIKAKYVAGFAAAEGCVSLCRGQRTLLLYQKDISKLHFIDKILHNMGFRNTKITKAYVSRLIITGRRDIEKYCDMIGYGHHQIKNAKLKEIVSGYKQYKIPYEETYQKIRETIEKCGITTCKDISNELHIDERYMNWLLNDMFNRGILNVDKSHHAHMYSVKVSE